MSDALINFVLDQSGSMQPVTNATKEGFNSFIKDQIDQPGEARISLTLFDTEFDVRFVAVPLKDLPELGSEKNSYRPGGGTALLDAVATTIQGTEGWLEAYEVQHGKPYGGKVLTVILTDGQENSSREWHLIQDADLEDEKDLANLIAAKQDEGWEFVFLGSGGTEWLEKNFSHVVDADRFVAYGHNAADTVGTYGTVSSSLTATRQGGARFTVDPNGGS